MHLSEKCIWKNDVILFKNVASILFWITHQARVHYPKENEDDTYIYTRANQDFWDTLRDAEFTLCATFLMGQWLNYEVRMWWLMFKFVFV